jgi:GNAT superfamily N-acetyltransferase
VQPKGRGGDTGGLFIFVQAFSSGGPSPPPPFAHICQMAFALDPTGMTLRAAQPDDLGAVDDLLRRSYPRLLAADYPPSVMVTAIPILARARPELLASGRYFLVWQGERLLGAGGFSLDARGGRAKARHLATDPDAVRQGIGRRLVLHILDQAGDAGATDIDALATRTAVPFYAALGFTALAERVFPLAPGIDFPAVPMTRRL